MKKVLTVTILIVVFLLSGCATTVPLSPANRKAVHNIKIDPNVKKPQQVEVETVGDNLLADTFGPFNPITISARQEENSKGHQIEQLQQANHINVAKILTAAMAKRLNQSGQFRVVSSKPDATLKLTLYAYTLMPAGVGFSTHLTPLLGVRGQLIKDNKVIWQNHYTSGLGSTLPHYSLTQIKNNPHDLELMLTAASNVIAKSAVDNMLYGTYR